MKTDEKILISNIKLGDDKSFGIIYNTYYTTLYRFSYKYLKSKSDAEEIVQTLFMKIWIHREELNVDLNFKSYLFQIAVNDIYNVFKKRIHEQSYQNYIKEKLSNNEYISLENNHFEFQDVLDIVYKVVDTFPTQRKNIFKMSKIEGFSYSEIAEKLNLSIRTVENQAYRAVKCLREEMEGNLRGVYEC